MKYLFLFLLSMCCAVTAAQTPEASISTDRPSVGSGADLVPPHHSQIESGFGLCRSEGSNNFDFPEMLLRYGLSSRFEFRLNTPNAHLEPSSPAFHEDIALGVKMRLGSETAKWPAALQLSLQVPTGSPELTAARTNPAASFIVSKSLTSRLSSSWTNTLAAVSSVPLPDRRFFVQSAGDVGWAWTARLNSFAEFAPFFDQGELGYGYTADAGVTWLARKNVQLDGRIGTTRAGGVSSLLLSVGYSIRR